MVTDRPAPGATPPQRPARRALVTGASRGIGAACAKRLASDGFHLVLNYRSAHEQAQSVAAEIRSQGGQVELAAFDVADAEASSKALSTILDAGPISVLVNNAGICRDNAFPAMSLEDWQVVTRTTLDGFYNVTHPLVMPMVRQRFGRIINLSSVSGVKGNRGQVNYSAAKAGIIGATKALAIELAKRKITVNAIAPGLIDTDMISAVPEFVVQQMIPMRRVGTVDEVASLVGYLASDGAAYITGQVIGMDGGL